MQQLIQKWQLCWLRPCKWCFLTYFTKWCALIRKWNHKMHNFLPLVLVVPDRELWCKVSTTNTDSLSIPCGPIPSANTAMLPVFPWWNVQLNGQNTQPQSQLWHTSNKATQSWGRAGTHCGRWEMLSLQPFPRSLASVGTWEVLMHSSLRNWGCSFLKATYLQQKKGTEENIF